MKRIMMVGAILLLSSAAARAQGLDLPDVTAKPPDAKKPAPKGDSLDLPSLDAKPVADAKKPAAKSDSLDLPPLDAKPAAKPVAKDVKAAKPATDSLDLSSLEAKPAVKEPVKEVPKEVAKEAPKEVKKDAPKPAAPVTKVIVAEKATSEGKERVGAASVPPGVVAHAAPPREEKGPWSVSLLAGAERGGERYIDSNTSLTRLGLEGAWNFSGNWALLGSFDFRSSVQGYVINHPSDTGEPQAPVQLDERRYDFRLGVGYDAGPKIVESKRLVLQPSLGLRLLTLQNEAFPTGFAGLEVGLKSSWELSRAVTVQCTLDYAYNFAESTTQSAVGSPKTHAGWTAGLVLPLDGGFALAFNYVGDLLAFRNIYRVAHGGALGFSTTF